MKTRSTIIASFTCLAFVGVAAFSLCQEMVSLSALQDVSAYSTDNWSYQDRPDAVIRSGSTVPIVGCVSDKSDVHEIVEISGHRYFVGPGSYTIPRRRASIEEAWFNPRAIFSCAGFLPGISREAPN